MAENVSENQFQYSKMSSTAYVSFRYINFKRFQADKQIQPIRFILGKLTVKKNWMIFRTWKYVESVMVYFFYVSLAEFKTN